MKANEFIRLSLDGGKNWLMALLADMKDVCITCPTPQGGNHPLWVIGHLAYTEAHIVSKFILGEENPLSKWKPFFDRGSQPVDDASQYPPFDELVAEFEKVRARTLQLVTATSDAHLDKASKASPEAQSLFGTIGKCYSTLIVHTAFHTGQVADARRAAGRKPMVG